MNNTFQHVTKTVGGSRFMFRYGMQQLGNQTPYFSVTGERYEDIRRTPSSCGCLHEDFARLYPELAYLVYWHLVDQDGTPMHYEANAIYFWEFLTGCSKWQAKGCQCLPIQGLASTVRWGALSGESDLIGLREQVGVNRDVFQKWLADRLPRLQTAFLADMERVGVKLIPIEVQS